jgi:hypothetical protein
MGATGSNRVGGSQVDYGKGSPGTDGMSVMADVIKNLQNLTGPTSISSVTETTREARSPELESRSQTFIDRLNEISAGTADAYAGKEATFEDLIRSLSNVSQMRAGQSAGATSTAALNSGLSPLEATQVGDNALNEVLQRYFPQLAQMRSDQADVPIAGQEAQRGLNNDYGDFLNSVLAPYLRAVAGTTTEKEGQETDMLGRLRAISDAAGQMERVKASQAGTELGYAELNEDARQADMSAELKRMGFDVDMAINQLREAGMDGRNSASLANALGIAQINSNTTMGTTAMREEGETARSTDRNMLEVLLENTRQGGMSGRETSRQKSTADLAEGRQAFELAQQNRTLDSKETLFESQKAYLQDLDYQKTNRADKLAENKGKQNVAKIEASLRKTHATNVMKAKAYWSDYLAGAKTNSDLVKRIEGIVGAEELHKYVDYNTNWKWGEADNRAKDTAGLINKLAAPDIEASLIALGLNAKAGTTDPTNPPDPSDPTNPPDPSDPPTSEEEAEKRRIAKHLMNQGDNN